MFIGIGERPLVCSRGLDLNLWIFPEALAFAETTSAEANL
jgi:hypothetical protein